VGSTVLDVGCGIGGTSRHLAKEHGCQVTGITISGKQVELAAKLTFEAGGKVTELEGGGALKFGDGCVRFIELDAEKMGEFFNTAPIEKKFDCVWISEAMSHLPNKKLFFENVFLLLKPGGKLVVADWFKDENLTEAQFKADISPIEGKCSQTV
jgi:tocopherol O-methyltransferase